MSGKGPRRELITASAGSGKTFQLTDRYLGLLLAGEKPESIVALTFSRKAAGEFFDAILKKLAEAASDEKARSQLNKRLEVNVSANEYRLKLAELLTVMHKLTLGTLDSFFNRILSRFPLEHGLGGDFSILDESSLQMELGRALEMLFRAGRESGSLREVLGSAYRQAREGSDDRRFADWMVKVSKHFRILRNLCEEEERWGRPGPIWPEGAPWLDLDEDYDPAADLAACRELIPGNAFSDPAFKEGDFEKWFSVLDALEKWSPGGGLERASALLKRVITCLGPWRPGLDCEIKHGRTDFALSENFCEPLSRVVQSILRREFERRMLRTQGAYRALSAADSVFEQQVRSRGGLTFADLPLLLGRNNDPLTKMEVEFRLDGEYRHWLLDEFQDTSPAQWRVLRNLVEEAINDPEDGRAFFCVGDVKQAIYGWRGGDSRLFGVLKERYESRLENSGLNESWRSGPDVLDTVNDVFGNLSSTTLTCPRWEEVWETHKPSELTENLQGHVAWWTSNEEDERRQALVSLLRGIDPIARGLSCAVLTQGRNTARELVDLLRLELPEVPVENEVGANPGSDNPFSVALLSLLRAAAHPEDGFSRGHLRMTPLGRLLAPTGDPDELNSALIGVLEQVCLEGFAPVLKKWGGMALKEVEKAAASFCSLRLRHVEELARRFDETGSRDVDAFIEFAKGSESAGGASEKSVRVMTIHKSKGLTFDMVILPELDGHSLQTLRRNSRESPLDLYVKNSEDGEGVEWTLDWPNSLFAEADPTLAGIIASDRNAAVFESLCKLYVGMTRPRQGLYLLSPRPSEKKNPPVNYVELLNQSLSPPREEDRVNMESVLPQSAGEMELRYSRGSFEWFFEHGSHGSESSDSLSSLLQVEDSVAKVVSSVCHTSPSKHDQVILGESLFGKKRDRATDIGTEVHELFEEIEWLEDDASVQAFLLESREKASATAFEHVRKVLDNKDTRALFAKPNEPSIVWREQTFSLLADGELVNGTFDRVVLRQDEAGYWLSAEIIDYKTDRDIKNEDDLEVGAGRHRKQLEFYRKTLCSLTGLPAEKITLKILFTTVPSSVYL
ncbi:MAG: UvrD-helicase domain-containing protein [Opitutae bacterium]|nr:UvrD-helicase domain-containing protein [Opitutae bacterium]